jgi:hypothetical protein
MLPNLSCVQTKHGWTLLHNNAPIDVSGTFIPVGEPIVRNARHYIVLQVVTPETQDFIESIDVYCMGRYSNYTPCLSGTHTILAKIPFRYKKYEVRNAHKLFEGKSIVATLRVEGIFDLFCSVKIMNVK